MSEKVQKGLPNSQRLKTKLDEHVILVDEYDREVGTVEKMEAHRITRRHRAFSVFVFNSQGQLMLQKRAGTKYHSGQLWTNTCCSHPKPGESVAEAAHRRLQEEMGFDCELEEIFSFTYQAQLDKDLFEHEYDHVLVGSYDGDPTPDQDEVENWKWISLETLTHNIREKPEHYTCWFKISIDRVMAEYLGDSAITRSQSKTRI